MILELEKLEEIDTIRYMCTANAVEGDNLEFAKQSQALLWHVRLGHASMNYPKILEKLDKRKLEEVETQGHFKELTQILWRQLNLHQTQGINDS